MRERKSYNWLAKKEIKLIIKGNRLKRYFNLNMNPRTLYLIFLEDLMRLPAGRRII